MKNLKLDFPVEMVLKHINEHSNTELFEYNALTESDTYKKWLLYWILVHGQYQQHLKNERLTNFTEVEGLREWCERYDVEYLPLDLKIWVTEQICNYCYDNKCSTSIELVRNKYIDIEKYDYVVKAPNGFDIGIRKRYPGSATQSHVYAEFRKRGTEIDYLPNHQLLYYAVAMKDQECLKFMLETMDSYEIIKSLQPWFENECTIDDCIEEAESYEYTNIEMLKNMPKLTNVEVLVGFFEMQDKKLSSGLVEIMQSTGTGMFEVYDIFNSMNVPCETATKLPELDI